MIHDSGQPDETPPDTALTPIGRLPDDVLMFLVSSRYCDSDNLADFAWSTFGGIAGGYRRVQAICDFVHSKIRFSYPDARPTRCASNSMSEGVGVCRDFAHLAVALCRCMNIPARYCTGYLGDIGVPVDINPMDFSGWFEVFLDGRWYTMDARHNHPAHRPHRHGTRSRRSGRPDLDSLRRRQSRALRGGDQRASAE